MIRIVVSFFLIFSSIVQVFTGTERRIGKLYELDWEEYYSLGANSFPYHPSESNPDLSMVGALLSRSGTLGTGTLIAPNAVVTAAHVIRNAFGDEVIPSDWEFLLGANENWSTSMNRIAVSSILIHPGWTARQNKYNRLGDGDELGVDIALVYLKYPFHGVFPARLPVVDDDPLGQRAVLAGYGSLVEGINGRSNESNQRRVGGENVFDRSVPKVQKDGVPDAYRGGLLAMDFDSSSSVHNSLDQEKPIIDLLGPGDSEAQPLPLEASTAYGDSGGPAFAHTSDAWRLHGVVSYGTKNSRYGDVTVFTRLASHHDWITSNIPAWPTARTIGFGDWRENVWWGYFLPFDNKWNYHATLGWVYVSSPSEDSFWAWQSSLGWVWFSKLAYPSFYSSESEDWNYLDIISSKAGRVLVYSYSLETWKYL